MLSEGLGEATGGEDESGGAGGDDGEAECYREHALRCVAGSHEQGWPVGGLCGEMRRWRGGAPSRTSLLSSTTATASLLDPPC